MKNTELLLDRHSLIKNICSSLEEIDNDSLVSIHRRICNSKIVHVGNSLFFPDEKMWEESKRRIKNDNEV